MLVEKGWDPSMGARPLRRAIQRYIEDPLADFVLRSQVPPGSTVMVEPAPDQDPQEREVVLTVIEPAPQPTPVGVGADGGGSGEDSEGEAPQEPAAPDTPAESE
jgi:ATP-dependent Clp protease ATP-binding subunit ClpC